jgi:hypothetical protein
MLTPTGVEMGAIGGTSFLLTSVASLIANSAKNRHEEHLAALQAASSAFKLTVKDTQDARKQRFPFARRAIVLSIFLMIPLLMFFLAKGHINITIPYHRTTSILFGLFHTDGYAFKTVNGFVLMMHPIADVMAMTAGFYFGSRFKQ